MTEADSGQNKKVVICFLFDIHGPKSIGSEISGSPQMCNKFDAE
jgi:hypothetical protein